jgi:hypothetical protein
MKCVSLLATASVCLLAGCQSRTVAVGEHWTERSVGSSMSNAFLSYDVENDGDYADFAWKKKQSINLTVRRHLFNHNPDNPFQSKDWSVYEERPPNSPVPRIWDYIHLEGLVMGGILYAGTGAFIPIPIDSLIATFSPGGDQEFIDGIGELVRPVGVMTASFMHESLNLPETAGHAWAE